MTAQVYDFWVSLLFDAELRKDFSDDATQVLAKSGLSEVDQTTFAQIDPMGLELDAQGRAQYLMSALCRSFPFTVACLGTMPIAARELQVFLKQIPSRAEHKIELQTVGSSPPSQNSWSAQSPGSVHSVGSGGSSPDGKQYKSSLPSTFLILHVKSPMGVPSKQIEPSVKELSKSAHKIELQTAGS